MNKKILITGLALSSCFLLASCGTSNEDAAIKSLANQIDKLNNVVANASTIDSNYINLDGFNNGEDMGAIKNVYQKTTTSINNQNSYKDKVLSKTATIKKILSSKDLKVGNKNLKALRELSSTLSKYTTKLANTNNDYKKTAKSISKLKNNNQTTNSMLGAKLSRLSSCADSRSCYYNNILNTLTQIQNLLNSGASVQNNILNNDYLNNYDFSNRTSIYDNSGNQIQGSYCENGVCYDQYGNVLNGVYFDSNGNCVSGNCAPNNGYYNNSYNVNQISNNNPNIYNNRYGNGNYNNGYANRRYNGFNPDRNTDTYAPNVKNIDTYRNNGVNNGFNYNVSETQDVVNDNIENQAEENILNTENTNSSLQQSESQEPQVIKENNIIPKQVEVKGEEKQENIKEVKKLSSEEIQKLQESEDGRNDIDPKTKNFKHTERVTKEIKDPLAHPKKIEEKANNDITTLQLNQDYKKTNDKIKDLIQNKTAVETKTENMFAL